MNNFQQKLPIDGVLGTLGQTLAASSRAVLSAEPGAGKTTRIPLAMVDQPWLAGKKIVMLEPRRLATRCAAEFMASQIRERTGQTVGYRIRGSSVTGPETHIEVVTEGILTRMLQHDPELPGVGLLIFDEFHERSINADLGLAFALDVQAHLRSDLRILVMSATLDVDAVARLLENAPVVKSEGRVYPVETIYARFTPEKTIEQRTANAVLRALQAAEGDILVFLPGRKELDRVDRLLYDKKLPEDIVVHELFGDAAYERQAAALTPDPNGKRKIILSTSIAETSLTIDGVRVVVDSGLARTARFDPNRGMSGLTTIPVSKAVADQRRGRAGRQQPGTCYRLWMENEQERLPDYPQPEIKVTDLAQLALDLAQWGTPDGASLRFLDPPPPAHLSQARSLLQSLGALDGSGKLTAHGKAMAEIPVHPRLAHMLFECKKLGLGPLACDVAALLEERISGGKKSDIDLADFLPPAAKTSERMLAQSARLRRMMEISDRGTQKNDDAGVALALAYPDRIARRRKEGSRYVLASGQTALLPSASLLARSEFLAVGDVDGLGAEVKIFLAAALTRQRIESVFAGDILTEEKTEWNEEEHAVTSKRITHIGAVVLSEQSFLADGDVVIRSMLEGIRSMGIECLPWDNDSLALQQRILWMRNHSSLLKELPDFSNEALMESLEEWLAPFLNDITRAAQLKNLLLPEIFRARFSPQLRQTFERLAPSHLDLPSGSHAALDYSGENPVLAVRLQELFGQTETPKICGGTVSVLVHLLSPAHRPLAVTQDLRSFWTNTYPEIRTQLRARYPRHVWPEDPLNAKPTNKTKRRQK
jgi:ATP-dependent helicase HrpB